MDENIREWLGHILECTEAIDEYLGEQRVFGQYLADKKTRRAVEREPSIIGEAVNRIMKVDQAFAPANARKIVGMRNRVIHNYDKVDDPTIWGIVNRDVPALRQEVETLLNQ